MILSNTAIHEALANGSLVIEPRPMPRDPSEGDNCPYKTTSIDLRLSSEISYFDEGLSLSINLRDGGFAKLFGNNSAQRTITEEQPFSLKPGKLVLGRTLEQVTFPLINGQCLAARVEGKSSYARCGLLVHFTAPTIHAGFSGTITLELINLGPYEIMLYPKTPICQLIIETVAGIPVRNDGQFQGQSQAGGNT